MRNDSRPPKPLRNLHVIASMEVTNGGDVRATQDLCITLAAMGETCEIATLDVARRAPGASTGAGGAINVPVIVRRFAPTAPRRLGNSRSLHRWLVRHAADYDLIEIHGIFRFTSLIAARAARRAGVPYIVHPHGSLDPHDLLKHRRAKRALAPLFDRLLLRRAGALVFTSRIELENANTFGAPTRRHCLPPPIQANDDEGDRRRFRERINAGDTAFVLLFMSRIDYKKGLIRTIRALALLLEEGLDVLLVVAGSGDPGYEARVAAEVKRLHLATRVRFTGFVEGQDKADAFAGADAFVLASDNENFGVVVVEALRAGVPVIISDRVAIAGDLAAADAAIVVAPQEEATAAGIAALVRDRERAAAVAEAGRRAAATLYDWRTVVGPRHHQLRRLIAGVPTEAQ